MPSSPEGRAGTKTFLSPTEQDISSSRGDVCDPRMGDLIERARGPSVLQGGSSHFDVVLIGAPDDLGIARNMGRTGACAAPDAIRRKLYSMTTGAFQPTTKLKVLDLGNVVPHPERPEETHVRLAAAVEMAVRRGAIPIVLGGGHDLTWGGITGLLRGKTTPGSRLAADFLGVIYLDAHLDMRDLSRGITSGTPFFRLLDSPSGSVQGRRMSTIGIQNGRNSTHHMDYAYRRDVDVVPLESARREGMEAVFPKALARASLATGGIALSIDMDAARSADAPGVSAPSPTGLDAHDMCQAASLAGEHPRVLYLDVMEVSPPFDPDGRTAALAANIIHHFLSGLCRRR